VKLFQRGAIVCSNRILVKQNVNSQWYWAPFIKGMVALVVKRALLILDGLMRK